MIKILNKISLIFLFCIQTNFVCPMVPPSNIKNSYTKWINAGNKGTVWDFIQKQMQTPSDVQVELDQSRVEVTRLKTEVTNLKSQQEEHKKQLEMQKNQIEEQARQKAQPTVDTEKQNLRQQLQGAQAELNRVKTELESAQASLAQQQQTFASKSEGAEAALQKQIDQLKTQLITQKTNFDSEKQKLLSDNLAQKNQLIEQQRQALAAKDADVAKQIQSADTRYENLQKQNAQLNDDLKTQQTKLDSETLAKQKSESELKQLRESLAQKQKDLEEQKLLMQKLQQGLPPQIQDMQNQINNKKTELEKRINDLLSKLSQLELDLTKAKQSNEALEREKQTLQSKIDGEQKLSAGNLMRLQTALDTANKTITDKNALLAEQAESRTKLIEESLRDTHLLTERNKDAIEKLRNVYEQSVEKIKRENEKLVKEKQQLEKKQIRLETENSGYWQLYDKFKEYEKNAKTELDDARKKLESQAALLKQQETTFATKDQGPNKTISDLTQEKTQLKDDLKKAKEDLEKQKSETTNKLKEQAALHEKEIETLKAQTLKEKGSETIAGLQKRLEAAEKKLEEVESENRKYAGDNTRLNFEIKRLQEELTSLKKSGMQEPGKKPTPSKSKKPEKSALTLNIIKDPNITGDYFQHLNKRLIQGGASWKDYFMQAFWPYTYGTNRTNWAKSFENILSFVDNSGENTFHYLVKHDAKDAIEYLIQQANTQNLKDLLQQSLNVQDNQGNTPLHYALERLPGGIATQTNKKDLLAVVNLLINKGANCYLYNKKNTTPAALISELKLNEQDLPGFKKIVIED
jgi:chromosome segregation ATPase